MTVINTNVAASITANALTKNERAMSQAMERLSTGQRINNAGDDAAGLAISSRMTSQLKGLNMAIRNANDAISMVQTEDGAMVEVTAILQRQRELAVQAASGTMTSTDRSALNTEFQALSAQIVEIGGNTQWNGSNILDGVVTSGAQSFHVGANASQTISHTFDVIGKNSSTVSQAATTAASAGAAQVTTLTISGTADGDVVTGTINGRAFAITLDDHNHATAGTFAFRRKLLEETSYDEKSSMAEEKKFLKDYSYKMVQLEPDQTIVCFSHIYISVSFGIYVLEILIGPFITSFALAILALIKVVLATVLILVLLAVLFFAFTTFFFALLVLAIFSN